MFAEPTSVNRRPAASCDGRALGPQRQCRGRILLQLLGDDHDLNEQIPDAEGVFAECEAGVQQKRLGLVAGAEQRYLVGVELRFPARHHPDEMPERAQEQHAGAPTVRPEDQELPTRLQDAMELAEDLPDLLPMKMLEHAEVEDSVERPLLERQGGDARLLDPTRARVVTGVEP